MATIGTDPEFFVAQEGNIIPVCGLLGGTKDEPVPLAGLPDGFGVQEDNVMAELTIPAAFSADGFSESIALGKDAINEMLEAHDATLFTGRCEYMFDQSALNQHANATMFGCSPDFQAYEQGRQRPTVTPAAVRNYRFCGGHVHIGTTCTAPKFVLAMFADAVLGLFSVGRDPQKARRQHYGEAGVFRPTPYGIEYRTMSNFWTTDAALTFEVGSLAMDLATFLDQGAAATREVMLSTNWNRVRELVSDGSNHMAARKLHRTIMGMIR